MSYRIELLESHIRDVIQVMRDEKSKDILKQALSDISKVHELEREAWTVKWKRVSLSSIQPVDSVHMTSMETKIELAENSRVDSLEYSHRDLVEEFMRDILGHEEALITDESEIRDFCIFEESWDEFQEKAVNCGLTSVGRCDRVVDVIADWITIKCGTTSNVIQFAPNI